VHYSVLISLNKRILQIQNLSDLVKPESNLCSRALKSVLDAGDSTFAAIVVPKGQVNCRFWSVPLDFNLKCFRMRGLAKVP
jgi:hypothetical protein